MVSTFSESVDWGTIHQQRFVEEPMCWTSGCYNGFCCNHNHPDFQFQLIPTNGSTIVYIKEEYEWLSRQGAVPGPDTTGVVPNELSFDFGGPRPLALLQMPCRLLGLCNGVIQKPLLCKVYPMFPVLGIDGQLEDVYPSSIFDLTMGLIGVATPCTVIVKRKHYFDLWRNSPNWLAALGHPYVILYLQAAKHFSEVYRMRLESNAKLKGLTGKDFWKRWELLYLGGQLVDGDLLAERIHSTYDRLVQRYGEFLTPA
jgi:hypothetical protein